MRAKGWAAWGFGAAFFVAAPACDVQDAPDDPVVMADAGDDGSACAAGACPVTLAYGESGSGAIALSATDVYWTASGVPAASATGVVRRVPKSGGAPVTIASGQDPYALAVDGASVYWTDFGASAFEVRSAPLGGGAPTTLARGSSGLLGLVVGAARVYWTDVAGDVSSAPLAGGAVASLATGQAGFALAIDATSLYWVDFGTGRDVKRLPLAGGAPQTLASNQDQGGSIAVDDASVYWITNPDLMKAPLAGGAPVKLVDHAVSAPTDLPFGVAVDGASVYWTDPGQGNVLKVSKGGGAVTTLATHQRGPDSIAVDATSVYWTNTGHGATDASVMKLTPK